MRSFQWTEDLSVHFPPLDRQHQSLIAIINELREAVESGGPSIKVVMAIEKLIEYTLMHFEYEEQCMSSACFRGLKGHQCEHQCFAGQVRALQMKHKAGQESIAVELIAVLEDWFEHHLKRSDRQYIKLLQHSGPGKAELIKQSH